MLKFNGDQIDKSEGLIRVAEKVMIRNHDIIDEAFDELIKSADENFCIVSVIYASVDRIYLRLTNRFYREEGKPYCSIESLTFYESREELEADRLSEVLKAKAEGIKMESYESENR